MGVDYSATVGWGLALTAEEAKEFISPDYIGEEEARDWLDEHQFEHIQIDCGGNWMSGEFVYLFALRDSISRLDWKFEDGFVSFDHPELFPEAGHEFRRLCMMFNKPWSDSLSWKLVFNVS